jgi:rhodanese-related sulfurtransferase
MSQSPLEVDVTTLKNFQDQKQDFFLLDVREESEYRTAKIPGGTLIPMSQLPSRVNELPKDKPIIVHCHHGGRSMRATQWLRQNGFTQTSNLAGGIDAWSCHIDASVPRY